MEQHQRQFVIPVGDDEWEKIIPVGPYMLIRPDPPKARTTGGVILPDSVRIPVNRGTILAISDQLPLFFDDEDFAEFPWKQYDKVIFHFGCGMPETFEKSMWSENPPNVLVPYTNIMAKVVKPPKQERRGAPKTDR